MNTTEFNIENLSSMISSDSSLKALIEMIGDMGLEVTEVGRSC